MKIPWWNKEKPAISTRTAENIAKEGDIYALAGILAQQQGGNNKNLLDKLLTVNKNWGSIFNEIPNPDVNIRKKGAAIFNEVESDPVVKGSMNVLIEAVNSREYELIKNKATKPELTLIERMLDDLFAHGLKDKLFGGQKYGYNPLELMWEIDKYNNYYVKKVVEQNHANFFFAKDEEINDYQLRYRTDLDMNGLVAPFGKILCPTYNTDAENPYGRGIITQAYRLYFLKKAVMDAWAIAQEEHGTPKLKAVISDGLRQYYENQGMNSTQILALIGNALNLIRQDGYVVHYEGVQVDTLEPKQSIGASQNEFVSYIDEQISILILSHQGGTISTPGKLGSEDVALSAIDTRVESICTYLENNINTLIEIVHKVNGFSGEAPWIRFYEKDDISKYKAKAELYGALAGIGVTFKKEFIASEFNIEAEGFEISNVGVGDGGLGSGKNTPTDNQTTNTDNNQESEAGNSQDFFSSKKNEIFNASEDDGTELLMDALDEVIADADANDKLMSVLMKPLGKIIDKYDTLEDLSKNYHKAFSDMDSGDMFNRLATARLLSYIIGYETTKMQEQEMVSNNKASDNSKLFAKETGELTPEDIKFIIKERFTPDEMKEYFKKRGIDISINWKTTIDIVKKHCFTAAGVLSLDILTDFKDLVEKAIDNGEGRAAFKKQLREKMTDKGWYSKGDGNKVMTASRLNLIYHNNTRAALHDSKWDAMKSTQDLIPYVISVARFNGQHPDSTKQCKQLHNKAFRKDDEYYMKNLRCLRHHNCYSTEVPATASKLRRMGLSVSKGIDFAKYKNAEGFDKTGKPWQPDMNRYAPELRNKLKVS